MEFAPPPPEQRPVRGLLYEDVCEREVGRLRPDQVGVCEPGQRVRRVELEDHRERPGREPSPQDRGRRQDVAVLVGQPVDPREEHAIDGRWNLRALVAREDPPSSTGTSAPASISDRTSSPMKNGFPAPTSRTRAKSAGGSAPSPTSETTRSRSAPDGNASSLIRTTCPHVRSGRPPWPAGAGLGARREDERDRLGRRQRDQPLQRPDRAGVGPVQVLDGDHERALSSGGSDERGDGLFGRQLAARRRERGEALPLRRRRFAGEDGQRRAGGVAPGRHQFLLRGRRRPMTAPTRRGAARSARTAWTSPMRCTRRRARQRRSVTVHGASRGAGSSRSRPRPRSRPPRRRRCEPVELLHRRRQLAVPSDERRPTAWEASGPRGVAPRARRLRHVDDLVLPAELDRGRIRPGNSSCTCARAVGPTSTDPTRASDWSLAAVFTTSPVAPYSMWLPPPTGPVTARPASIPTRTPNGSMAYSRRTRRAWSATRRWISSPARTARSVSSSCATGAPNRASTPSPATSFTVPPNRSTVSAIARTAPPTTSRTSSGSNRSASAVDPATSADSAVIVRRSSRISAAGRIEPGPSAEYRERPSRGQVKAQAVIQLDRRGDDPAPREDPLLDRFEGFVTNDEDRVPLDLEPPNAIVIWVAVLDASEAGQSQRRARAQRALAAAPSTRALSSASRSAPSHAWKRATIARNTTYPLTVVAARYRMNPRRRVPSEARPARGRATGLRRADSTIRTKITYAAISGS